MYQDANFCQRQSIISLKNLAARYGSSLPCTFSATLCGPAFPKQERTTLQHIVRVLLIHTLNSQLLCRDETLSNQ